MFHHSTSSGGGPPPAFFVLFVGFVVGYWYRSSEQQQSTDQSQATASLGTSLRAAMDAFVPIYTVAVVTVFNLAAFLQMREEGRARMEKREAGRARNRSSSDVGEIERNARTRSPRRLSAGLLLTLSAFFYGKRGRRNKTSPSRAAGTQTDKAEDRPTMNPQSPSAAKEESSKGTCSSVVPHTNAGKNGSGKVDLSGSYKLERNINFQEFLASQGVNRFLRKAADKAVTVNHITHAGDTLKIRVAGIVSSETTYVVNGPPVETRIQSKVFRDSVTYNDTGNGVVVKKVNEEDNYHILVRRRLTPCGQKMNIQTTAVFPDGREVESTQIFRRIPP